MDKRAMRKSTNADGQVVNLTRLEEAELEIEIVGITPYIPGKWSEKAKRMLPGHPDKPPIREAKQPHDPEAEAEAHVYRTADGRPAVPAVAFKAAMVDSCRFFNGITMVQAKVAIHVVGEGADQLVPLETDEPILREDTPRNNGGGVDLRYRYAFPHWRAKVKIRFIPSALTTDSVVALLDAAGRQGVGEWRPSAPKSHTGTYGQWHVVSEEDE